MTSPPPNLQDLMDVNDNFWDHPSLLKYTNNSNPENTINTNNVKKRKLDAVDVTHSKGPQLKKRKISEANDCDFKDNPASKLFLLAVDTEVHDWRNCDQNGNSFSANADPDSRLTQIAWSMYDRNGNKLKTKSMYIKPDGWSLSEKAADYTNITSDMLQKEGIPITSALQQLRKDFGILTRNNGYIAAHKYAYDATVILNEIKKSVYANSTEFEELIATLQLHSDSKQVKEANIIDTCDIALLETLNENSKFAEQLASSNSKDVRKGFSLFFKKKNAEGEWKRMGKTFGTKLVVMHKFICGGRKSDDAHNASTDAEMCGELIFKLKKEYNIDLCV